MDPSIVRFPLNSSNPVLINLESLLSVAPQVGKCLVSGDVMRLSSLLYKDLGLPFELHEAAVREISVGLSLSRPPGVPYFDDTRVGRMTNKLRRFEESAGLQCAQEDLRNALGFEKDVSVQRRIVGALHYVDARLERKRAARPKYFEEILGHVRMSRPQSSLKGAIDLFAAVITFLIDDD